MADSAEEMVNNPLSGDAADAESQQQLDNLTVRAALCVFCCGSVRVALRY